AVAAATTTTVGGGVATGAGGVGTVALSPQGRTAANSAISAVTSTFSRLGGAFRQTATRALTGIKDRLEVREIRNALERAKAQGNASPSGRVFADRTPGVLTRAVDRLLNVVRPPSPPSPPKNPQAEWAEYVRVFGRGRGIGGNGGAGVPG